MLHRVATFTSSCEIGCSRKAEKSGLSDDMSTIVIARSVSSETIQSGVCALDCFICDRNDVAERNSYALA